MVCTKYVKRKDGTIIYYYPVLEDYIHSEQFNREIGGLEFQVPEKIKCKKALPFMGHSRKIDYRPSVKGSTRAFYLFQHFVSSVDNFYPEIICTKLEKGKYLKYQFKYFYTYSYTNIPLVVYEPVDVVSKKEAQKYLACIDKG